MSNLLHSNNNKYIEVILFMIPAHLFNSLIIVFPMFISLLLGYSYYDSMLEKNGFRPVGVNIIDS